MVTPYPGQLDSARRSSVLGVTMNERQLVRGSTRLAAVRKTRSVALIAGRPVRRRKSASSCVVAQRDLFCFSQPLSVHHSDQFHHDLVLVSGRPR